MDNPPPIDPRTAQLGTTMRIEIAPELADKHRKSGRLQRHAKAPVSVPGGVDFQQLLQNIYDAVLITDLTGEIVMVNSRANQFFLAQPAQLTGYNILGLICGADPTLLGTILETLQGNRFVLMQAHCLRLDTTVFAAEISANRLLVSGKEHLSFFIRDVTLRKAQEEELRTGHTALQNASSGIVITGLDACIQYSNPAFLPLVGLDDCGTVEGRQLHEFLCEPSFIERFLEATDHGETWAGELEMRRCDNTTFFAQASVAPNLNTEGTQVGLVFSVLDVTAQKNARAQLEAYASELNTRNSQLQEDLSIASELHQALLPSDFHFFPKGASEDEALARFSHLYFPSGSIGGDFFDIRQVSPSESAFFIADVMGHGIRSALVVATLRGLLEEARSAQSDPGQLLTQLNATYSGIFKRLGGEVVFATAFYGVLDSCTGRLRYANASHPLPYLLRRSRNTLERVAPKGPSAPLGLFADTAFATSELEMSQGDLLFLYTDGLSETENLSNESYEGKRLRQALEEKLQLPAQELLEFLSHDAQQHSSDGAFCDDVCLLAVELLRQRA